jgi:Rhodanese-related sulfurtransferase
MSTSSWILGAIAIVVALLIIKHLLGGGKMPANTVLEKIKSGAKIVDVRSPEEFQDGAYPGAINIPLPELSQRMGEIPKDKPVVLYCLSGARSASAARTLKKAGYTDVINAGGLGDMPR